MSEPGFVRLDNLILTKFEDSINISGQHKALTSPSSKFEVDLNFGGALHLVSAGKPRNPKVILKEIIEVVQGN